MDQKNGKRYINTVIAVLGLVIASAVVWEMFFPDSHFAKVTGFIAFGMLYVFLRSVPRGFFISKPKK
jgi:hypothetical protein